MVYQKLQSLYIVICKRPGGYKWMNLVQLVSDIVAKMKLVLLFALLSIMIQSLIKPLQLEIAIQCSKKELIFLE